MFSVPVIDLDVLSLAMWVEPCESFIQQQKSAPQGAAEQKRLQD